MRKIIISIPTIKYIISVEKINRRIKKKDTGEASFIYRNRTKDEDPLNIMHHNRIYRRSA